MMHDNAFIFIRMRSLCTMCKTIMGVATFQIFFLSRIIYSSLCNMLIPYLDHTHFSC